MPARNNHTATVLPGGETVLITGGDNAAGTTYTSAEIFTLGGEPAEEPPVEEEPPTDVALTFADIADIPIPDLTPFVSFVPDGFSLISVSGLGAIFAASAAEDATLSVAQGANVPPFLVAFDDIADLPFIPIDWFFDHAFANPDGIISIFSPNDGSAWNKSLPPGLRSLKGITPGWGYWVLSDGPNALIDYVTSLPHTVTPVPNQRFTAFGYFGAPLQLNPAANGFLPINGTAGGGRVFDSPFDERLLYQWLGGDQGWNLYSPGAPALVQTIEEILPHHTFFAAGTEPLLMLPAELNFGSCDTVALIGGDTGPLDTAVTRTQDANPDFPAGEGEVEVQLVALSLVSVEPITVTFNDGRDPQEWDVQVCLSDQQTGRMTIQLNEEDGGTSDADFPVPESDG